MFISKYAYAQWKFQNPICLLPDAQIHYIYDKGFDELEKTNNIDIDFTGKEFWHGFTNRKKTMDRRHVSHHNTQKWTMIDLYISLYISNECI